MSSYMRIGCTVFALVAGAGCTTSTESSTSSVGSSDHTQSAFDKGRDIWFEETFGGSKFFAFLERHPDPTRRIRVGFDKVVQTPRAERFEAWGTINDPDCVANPDGGADICPDPEASGIVGIRKHNNADGTLSFSIACASCHAGFDPEHPPADPNEPTWDNIHPTIGNQFLKTGAIFAANLPAHDPRQLLFASWPDGTVDTTLLFSDNIMNPGTITAFWNHQHRPAFDVGLDAPKLRNGQGGEDDVGGDLAALRVYTNIGVCFQECVAPAVATGRPISIAECRAECPDFPTDDEMHDLVAFLGSIRAPKLRMRRNGRLFARGRKVFQANCVSCHDDSGKQHQVLSNDAVNPLWELGDQATNACRALTTNWEEGRIWAEFSSQLYKDRAASGDKGYRSMPLAGIWSTAPFLHNQSVGSWAPPTATVEERAQVFEQSMLELLSDERTPKINRLPVALGPFPAGTPLTYVFSRDPSTGELLCADAIENRGHTFGASLSDQDKLALIEWLKFQ